MKPQFIEDTCFKICIVSNFRNLRENVNKIQKEKKGRKVSRCKDTNEANSLTGNSSLDIYHYLTDFQLDLQISVKFSISNPIDEGVSLRFTSISLKQTSAWTIMLKSLRIKSKLKEETSCSSHFDSVIKYQFSVQLTGFEAEST